MNLSSKIGAAGLVLAVLTLAFVASPAAARVADAQQAGVEVALNPQPLPPRAEPEEEDFDRG